MFILILPRSSTASSNCHTLCTMTYSEMGDLFSDCCFSLTACSWCEQVLTYQLIQLNLSSIKEEREREVAHPRSEKVPSNWTLWKKWTYMQRSTMLMLVAKYVLCIWSSNEFFKKIGCFSSITIYMITHSANLIYTRSYISTTTQTWKKCLLLMLPVKVLFVIQSY